MISAHQADKVRKRASGASHRARRPMQDVAHARFAAKQVALADRRQHANENVNSIGRWDDEGGAPPARSADV